MKDLKHYFEPPKGTGNSDQSLVSNGSPEWTAERQTLAQEGSLKITFALKGKKKKKRKSSSDKLDTSLEITNALPIVDHSSPHFECKPARKRRKYSDHSNLDQLNINDSFSSEKTIDHKICNEQVNDVATGKRKKSNSFTNGKKKKKGIVERKLANDSKKEEVELTSQDSNGSNAEFISSNISTKKSQVESTPENLPEIKCKANSSSRSSEVEFGECSPDITNGDVKKRGKKSKKSKKKQKVEKDVIASNGKESNVAKSSPLSDSSLQNTGKFTPISEAKNKILNYFNKVDKLPEIPQQRVSVLKVEAIVHSPPTGKAKVSSVDSKKKLKMKRRNINAEIDLITSEEDSILENTPSLTAIQNKKSWQMRVRMSKSIESENDDSLSSVLSAGHTVVPDKKGCTEMDQKEDTFSEDGDVKIVLEEETPTVENKTPLPKSAKLSRSSGGTLTSFFSLKSLTKSQNNILKEERLAAKQQFLESGVPENMKKLIKTKVCETVLGSPAPYPKHSHIRQKDKMNIVWNLPKIVLAGDPVPLSSDVSNLDWTIHIKNIEDSAHAPRITDPKPFASVENIRNSIKKLKKEAKDFPVSVWYKELKAMQKNNEYEMWIEKYKPTVLNHFIGNRKNIEKFKSWLENHRVGSKTGQSDSSGDEFANSDDETKKVQNIALLVGPNGCGKTSAVYAMASQLGYQVLELNASCNRSGKRLLLEFSEATQSHKLKVSSNFFGNKKKEKGESERTLLLLEDADLVFQDYDEGFLSAVNYLMSSTKRPVILIANDENCKHLNKFMSNCQLYLKFNNVESKHLGCWLRTLSLAEGLSIDDSESTRLAEISNCDVRQALLQLQMCSSPKLTRKQLLLRRPTNSRWIWEKAGDYDLKKKKELMKLRRLLKPLLVADLITSKTPPPRKLNNVETGPMYWDTSLKDSTCVEESLSTVPDIIGAAIVDELQVIAGAMTTGNSDCCSTASLEESTKKNILVSGDLDGGIGLSTLLSRRSVATDYLSAIRQIAISEKSRLVNQTKRNNRYFNHLQTIGINPTESVLSVLTSTFAESRPNESPKN